ncbi:MAG: hypothetical protein RIR60_1341, partial [Pseudomonadota bacterium]
QHRVLLVFGDFLSQQCTVFRLKLLRVNRHRRWLWARWFAGGFGFLFSRRDGRRDGAKLLRYHGHNGFGCLYLGRLHLGRCGNWRRRIGFDWRWRYVRRRLHWWGWRRQGGNRFRWLGFNQVHSKRRLGRRGWIHRLKFDDGRQRVCRNGGGKGTV